jgi:hypothetical protein
MAHWEGDVLLGKSVLMTAGSMRLDLVDGDEANHDLGTGISLVDRRVVTSSRLG